MTIKIEPEEIRALRSAREWTQQELAAHVGTDAVTVSRWERGVSRPRSAVHRDLTALVLESGPRGGARLVENPTVRIRRIETALRQMKELKRHLQHGA